MIPDPVICLRDRREELVHARTLPCVPPQRRFNLIQPSGEWADTADTTERSTLRPAMAVDGKRAGWNQPTSRAHFPCHSSAMQNSAQHFPARIIP